MMLEGPVLIVILIGAIGFIIFATAIIKLHPFLSLLMATFGVGFIVRMPLMEIIDAVNRGFGGMMGTIGLIIIFGTIIGTVLEKSGGAITMADVVLRTLGKKRPALAMSLIGAIVSIPVFCDSAFVILAKLNRAIARQSQVPLSTMTIALASGLYATHTLVPPTPGPIAAAGNLGAANYLGTVIWIGLLTAIPVILVGYWWALRVGRTVTIEGEQANGKGSESPANARPQPSAFKAFTPIVLPVMLIALASIVKSLGWNGGLADLTRFIGNPLVALFLGVLVSFRLMPKFDSEHLNGWVGAAIVQAGPILLITGTGGAFGSLLKATPMTALITGLVGNGQVSGWAFIVIAFSISAALKSSQGSSTAALVITSSLLAPFIGALGMATPVSMALVVMAIGSGAMVVSHVNDSYFWVVSQFSGLTLSDAYRSFTVVTLLQGLTGLVTTLVLYSLLT